MRKVLVISYSYPPIAGVAAIPVVKIVKYLTEFEWFPIVLTVKNPDPLIDKIDPGFFEKEDYMNIKKVGAYCFSLGLIFGGVERLWRSIRAIMIPDIYVGWIPHAVWVAKKVIEKEGIDVIYSTYLPATNVIIGTILKKITCKPLVLDYRDVPAPMLPTKLHAWVGRKIHEWALRCADFVIVVNSSEKETLLKCFPFLDESRVKILQNYYDLDDFKGVNPVKFDKFTFLHAGGIFRVYFKGIDRITPFRIFAEAISELIRRKFLSCEEFQVILIGWIDPSIKQMIRDLSLERVIKYEGVKSHKETISYLLGADVLLIFPGYKAASTTKLFEYLAARRFILNIGNEAGEVSKILLSANCGITVRPDKEELKETIVKIIKGDITKDIDYKDSFIKMFSAREVAKKLACILNSSLNL